MTGNQLCIEEGGGGGCSRQRGPLGKGLRRGKALISPGPPTKVWAMRWDKLYPPTVISLILPSTAPTEEEVAFSAPLCLQGCVALGRQLLQKQ